MSRPAGGRRAPLRLAAAQPSLLPYEVRANVAAHAAAVLAAGADVVLFPELSLTGYHLDAPALSPADPALTPLVAACQRTGTVALVGAPVGDSDEFIGVLAVDGDGVTVAYRKMWLGEEEARRFTAGPTPAVLDVAGWRLGLAVCKDTGVPQHQQRTMELGVDAYLAGTVMLPQERAEQDRRGSSIAAAYGVWVALAGFAGGTGAGYDATAGGSTIWSPAGVVVDQVGAAPDLVATAELH